MKHKHYRELSSDEKYVILAKGTEPPFSGEYENLFEKGDYHCKQCNALLFRSEDKFHSGCGWPSFDDEIEGAVKRIPDKDGIRTEIVCANCGGHLGHVFKGEDFTSKNTRHCVNSLSLHFEPQKNKVETKKAYFAAGCFWGVEHLLKRKEGVLVTKCGYMGGSTTNPTYKEVCYTDCGHLETVEVFYDPAIVSYEELCRFFFEIHDPTQINGQGPDHGKQYASAVFTSNDGERDIVATLIGILNDKGYDVTTAIRPKVSFWPAEEYHQDYYTKSGKEPYCHYYSPKF